MSADRFRRAQWRVLLATMFCYLFYYTGRQTFGFAIPGIKKELGIGNDTLGWVSAGMPDAAITYFIGLAKVQQGAGAGTCNVYGTVQVPNQLAGRAMEEMAHVDDGLLGE